MSGPIYNAVRGRASVGGSTAVRTVSPTGSAFSGTTANTITKGDLRDATKHRKGFAIFTAVLFAVAFIFLLLLNIGNVSNTKVINEWYFFKIDISKIVPKGNNGQPGNAKSVGLRDFYQVGLWGFCEGYNDLGITRCSKPILMYWFNPVQIMVDEVLNGASGKLCLNLHSCSVLRSIQSPSPKTSSITSTPCVASRTSCSAASSPAPSLRSSPSFSVRLRSTPASPPFPSPFSPLPPRWPRFSLPPLPRPCGPSCVATSSNPQEI